VLRETGKPTAALAAYGNALAIQQKLAEASPSVPGFQSELAKSLASLGLQLSRIGRLDEALDYGAQEQAIWKKLVEQNPAVTDYQNSLAKCQTNMAELRVKIDNEPGLHPLRSRLDFPMLILDVAFPADPFAHGD
jgi:hypothetical protein